MKDLAETLWTLGLLVNEYVQKISNVHPKVVLTIAIAGMIVCLLIISTVFGPKKEEGSTLNEAENE